MVSVVILNRIKVLETKIAKLHTRALTERYPSTIDHFRYLFLLKKGWQSLLSYYAIGDCQASATLSLSCFCDITKEAYMLSLWYYSDKSAPTKREVLAIERLNEGAKFTPPPDAKVPNNLLSFLSNEPHYLAKWNGYIYKVITENDERINLS